jgi:hypothetical protein
MGVVLQYMGNSRKKGIQDSGCEVKWGLAKTINDTEEVLYERDCNTDGAQAQANCEVRHGKSIYFLSAMSKQRESREHIYIFEAILNRPMAANGICKPIHVSQRRYVIPRFRVNISCFYLLNP